jgi:hypothetical protein
MDGVRPTNPNFVSVGMMNCRPAQPLPDKLQKFMDESGDDGVILVDLKFRFLYLLEIKD